MSRAPHRPELFAEIEALEDALAALDAADEAARIVALRATRDDDLVEADRIRAKLAIIWRALVQQRQRVREQLGHPSDPNNHQEP